MMLSPESTEVSVDDIKELMAQMERKLYKHNMQLNAVRLLMIKYYTRIGELLFKIITQNITPK